MSQPPIAPDAELAPAAWSQQAQPLADRLDLRLGALEVQ